jgi:parvulin-like peptidyl-prolyl isomerase
MPEPVRKILDTLNLGDISPIIKIDSRYRIIRFLGRREEEVQEFNKVKNAVYRASFEEQLNALLNKYVAQLKKDAEITINDDAVRSIEKRYQK